MLARSRSCCHRATTSTVVRRFFRGTASLYIFSILFSRKSRVPLDAAFSYLFLFIPRLLFLPQGLFLPLRCIPSSLFCAAGIISSAQMHPQLALLCRRDYFFCPDSSLSCFFVPQGLFLPLRCISILLFPTTGIIATARIHPYLALFLRRDDFFCSDASPACFFHHRDYFDRSDSSLSCFFLPQGLFLLRRFIPVMK